MKKASWNCRQTHLRENGRVPVRGQAEGHSESKGQPWEFVKLTGHYSCVKWQFGRVFWTRAFAKKLKKFMDAPRTIKGTQINLPHANVVVEGLVVTSTQQNVSFTRESQLSKLWEFLRVCGFRFQDLRFPALCSWREEGRNLHCARWDDDVCRHILLADDVATGFLWPQLCTWAWQSGLLAGCKRACVEHGREAYSRKKTSRKAGGMAAWPQQQQQQFPMSGQPGVQGCYSKGDVMGPKRDKTLICHSRER